MYFTHRFNAQTNYLFHAMCKMPLVQQVANPTIGHGYTCIYLVQCDVFLSVHVLMQIEMHEIHVHAPSTPSQWIDRIVG